MTIAGAWARDYQLSNRFYVDIGTVCPASIQDGSIARPFSTIPQAITALKAIGDAGGSKQWIIELASGVYPDTISLPANYDVLFVGTIRRGAMTISGNITWTVANPALSSRLGFRQVILNGSLTIVDGASPAAPAVLTLEGCQLGATAGGSVVQTTGSSIVTVAQAGMSTSGFATSTSPVVQSALAAQLLLPGSSLWLSGTQCRPVCTLIRIGTLRALTSSFEQPIEITSATDPRAEFQGCSFPAPGRTLTFTGTPGIAYFDAFSRYTHELVGSSVVNGSYLGGAIFAPDSGLGFAARFDGAAHFQALARFNSTSEFNQAATFNALATFNSIATFSNQVRTTGSITPATITTATHNWDPPGLADAFEIRATASGTQNLTGIAGGTPGRMLLLSNVSTATGDRIKPMHENTGSTAVNRFILPAYADMTAFQRGNAVLFRYDGIDQRWRVASIIP